MSTTQPCSCHLSGSGPRTSALTFPYFLGHLISATHLSLCCPLALIGHNPSPYLIQSLPHWALPCQLCVSAHRVSAGYSGSLFFT